MKPRLWIAALEPWLGFLRNLDKYRLAPNGYKEGRIEQKLMRKEEDYSKSLINEEYLLEENSRTLRIRIRIRHSELQIRMGRLV